MNAEKLVKEYDSKSELVEFNKQVSVKETLQQNNKELKTFVKSNGSVYSVRIFVNGAWGFSSTSNEEEVEELFKKSYKLARGASRIKKEKTRMKSFPTIKDEVDNMGSIDFRNISDEEKIKLLHDFNNAYELGSIKNVDTRMSLASIRKLYINNKGSRIKQEMSYSQLTSSIVGGENLINANLIRRARKGYELLKDFNYERRVRELEEKLTRLMHAGRVKPGKYDVIVDPELSGTFFHEAVGHALEADHLRENNTCLELGQRVSGQGLTLYDDPTLEDYWGSYSYDDEGIRASPSLLINKGIITNFMNDLSSYFDVPGLEKTSNARFDSPHNLTQPRMSNIVVKSGGMNKLEMIQSMKNGLLVKGFRGGAVEPVTGVFSFKAEEALVVRDGEVVENLRGVNLSGDLKQVLKSIKGIGKDAGSKYRGGMCGKGGQIVPVSEKVPHVLVEGVNVGN